MRRVDKYIFIHNTSSCMRMHNVYYPVHMCIAYIYNPQYECNRSLAINGSAANMDGVHASSWKRHQAFLRHATVPLSLSRFRSRRSVSYFMLDVFIATRTTHASKPPPPTHTRIVHACGIVGGVVVLFIVPGNTVVSWCVS